MKLIIPNCEQNKFIFIFENGQSKILSVRWVCIPITSLLAMVKSETP